MKTYGTKILENQNELKEFKRLYNKQVKQRQYNTIILHFHLRDIANSVRSWHGLYFSNNHQIIYKIRKGRNIMKKKSNKKKGMDFENKVQKTLSSGALWFDKGDLKTKNHVIECKFTEKKGFRITLKMLKKLFDEACDANKQPALIIGIKDEEYLWTLTAKLERERK